MNRFELRTEGEFMENMDLFSRLIVRRETYSPCFLKWEDETVGLVDENNNVEFVKTFDNLVLKLYGANGKWSAADFQNFLFDRVPSPNRRDIEEILQRCGLVKYDVFKLARTTRAFNAKDLFWLALDENEKMQDIIPDVFSNIYNKPVDMVGDSTHSPDGQNVKKYGLFAGKYGLYKKRLHPLSTDVESEVAVANFAKVFGVECCPAYRVKVGKDYQAFSVFRYDFSKEYVVHARALVREDEDTSDLYKWMLNVLPMFETEIHRMLLLDFVTRQDDRHLSNFSLKVRDCDIQFYPMYDNGRSLFYEDSTSFMDEAIEDIPNYATSFGQIGTYWDIVQEIAKKTDIRQLVNLDVPKHEIINMYKIAGLEGEKLRGASYWTERCLDLLKQL